MFVWTHQDPRGLDKANVQALARCQIMAWGVDAISQSDGSRAEDLLTLIAASFVVRQDVIDAGKGASSSLSAIGQKLSLSVTTGDAPDLDHQNAQYILLRSWEALGRAEGWNDSSAAQLSANTGRAPGSNVQSNAVAIVAIVVGIIALAGLIAFVVYNVNTMIDRQLTRRSQAQEMMRAHAECQAMLEAHAAAERKAGHALPFTTVELQIMARLARAQDQVMQSYSGSLKASDPTNIQPPGPWDAAQTIGVLAVVLGFIYYLTKEGLDT